MQTLKSFSNVVRHSLPLGGKTAVIIDQQDIVGLLTGNLLDASLRLQLQKPVQSSYNGAAEYFFLSPLLQAATVADRSIIAIERQSTPLANPFSPYSLPNSLRTRSLQFQALFNAMEMFMSKSAVQSVSQMVNGMGPLNLTVGMTAPTAGGGGTNPPNALQLYSGAFYSLMSEPNLAAAIQAQMTHPSQIFASIANDQSVITSIITQSLTGKGPRLTDNEIFISGIRRNYIIEFIQNLRTNPNFTTAPWSSRSDLFTATIMFLQYLEIANDISIYDSAFQPSSTSGVDSAVVQKAKGAVRTAAVGYSKMSFFQHAVEIGLYINFMNDIVEFFGLFNKDNQRYPTKVGNTTYSGWTKMVEKWERVKHNYELICPETVRTWITSAFTYYKHAFNVDYLLPTWCSHLRSEMLDNPFMIATAPDVQGWQVHPEQMFHVFQGNLGAFNLNAINPTASTVDNIHRTTVPARYMYDLMINNITNRINDAYIFTNDLRSSHDEILTKLGSSSSGYIPSGGTATLAPVYIDPTLYEDMPIVLNRQYSEPTYKKQFNVIARNTNVHGVPDIEVVPRCQWVASNGNQRVALFPLYTVYITEQRTNILLEMSRTDSTSYCFDARVKPTNSFISANEWAKVPVPFAAVRHGWTNVIPFSVDNFEREFSGTDVNPYQELPYFEALFSACSSINQSNVHRIAISLASILTIYTFDTTIGSYVPVIPGIPTIYGRPTGEVISMNFWTMRNMNDYADLQPADANASSVMPAFNINTGVVNPSSSHRVKVSPNTVNYNNASVPSHIIVMHQHIPSMQINGNNNANAHPIYLYIPIRNGLLVGQPVQGVVFNEAYQQKVAQWNLNQHNPQSATNDTFGVTAYPLVTQTIMHRSRLLGFPMANQFDTTYQTAFANMLSMYYAPVIGWASLTADLPHMYFCASWNTNTLLSGTSTNNHARWTRYVQEFDSDTDRIGILAVREVTFAIDDFNDYEFKNTVEPLIDPNNDAMVVDYSYQPGGYTMAKETVTATEQGEGVQHSLENKRNIDETNVLDTNAGVNSSPLTSGSKETLRMDEAEDTHLNAKIASNTQHFTNPTNQQFINTNSKVNNPNEAHSSSNIEDDVNTNLGDIKKKDSKDESDDLQD